MKRPSLLHITRKIIFVCLTIFVTFNTVYAADFLDEARRFLKVPNIPLDENQKFIARLNQFTAEGNYTNQQHAETLLIRAIIFSRLMDFDNAFESYSTAIDSGNLTPILKAEAFKNRGLLYYQSKQYSQSKNDFESALEILKGNAELHYYAANANFGMLRFDEAVEQYNIALDGMANKRFLAYYGIASVYFQQQRFEDSKRYILLSLEDYKAFEPAKKLLKEIQKLEGIEAIEGNLDENNITANGVDEKTDNIVNDNNAQKTTSANDIYNQLLKQALAAKKKDGMTKQLTFKLDVEPEKKQSQMQPDSKDILTANKQVSDQPFLLDDQKVKTRLDDLLVDDNNTKLEGYFVQLASGNNEKDIETVYQMMFKKHKVLLNNRPYLIRKFTAKSHKVSYQLLISGFSSYKQANSLCKFIKQQQSECFVRLIK